MRIWYLWYKIYYNAIYFPIVFSHFLVSEIIVESDTNVFQYQFMLILLDISLIIFYSTLRINIL